MKSRRLFQAESPSTMTFLLQGNFSLNELADDCTSDEDEDGDDDGAQDDDREDAEEEDEDEEEEDGYIVDT